MRYVNSEVYIVKSESSIPSHVYLRANPSTQPWFAQISQDITRSWELPFDMNGI